MLKLILQQYTAIKAKHPDTLLLMECGGFWEAFNSDAELLSKELNLLLTKRENVSICGFPSECLDKYLPLIVRKIGKTALIENVCKPLKNKNTPPDKNPMG